MDPLDPTRPTRVRRRVLHRKELQQTSLPYLVAVTSGDPRVLTIQDQHALPSGPFELAHRSLQSGLRAWVERQTRLPLTSNSSTPSPTRDRAAAASRSATSVTQEAGAVVRLFPWKNRLGPPSLVEKICNHWPFGRARSGDAARPPATQPMLFGFEGHVWNEELVLQRYELYEARLIPEALRGNSRRPTRI